MELKTAKNIATEICYLFQPYCEIIKIAGSVRRKKQEVHDIEICLIPKVENIKTDLFDNVKQVRDQDFINITNKLGKIVKGSAADGKMMQIELPENIMLDLFMPDDFDFYRQYAIRTGSAYYSQKVIASGWLKIGWCGSDKGLRKQSDCIATKKPDGKTDWKCVTPNAELPPLWIDEKDFFDWIKVKYLPPTERNL